MILAMMLRRSLALLLVLCWITLSGMDALEDLDFDSHTTRDVGAAAGWPTASKPVKLAKDIPKSASGNPLSFERVIQQIKIENAVRQARFDVYPSSQALRIRKEHSVLLI
jgi:hypothetical protein